MTHHDRTPGVIEVIDLPKSCLLGSGSSDAHTPEASSSWQRQSGLPRMSVLFIFIFLVLLSVLHERILQMITFTPGGFDKNRPQQAVRAACVFCSAPDGQQGQDPCPMGSINISEAQGIIASAASAGALSDRNTFRMGQC